MSKLIAAELWGLVRDKKFYVVLSVSLWVYIFVGAVIANPDMLILSGTNVSIVSYLGIMLQISNELFLGVGLTIYYAASVVNKQIESGQIWYYKNCTPGNLYFVKTINVITVYGMYCLLNLVNLSLAYYIFFTKQYSEVFVSAAEEVTSWDIAFIGFMLVQQVVQFLVGYIVSIGFGATYGILAALGYYLLGKVSDKLRLIKWLFPINYLSIDIDMSSGFYIMTVIWFIIFIFVLICLGYLVFRKKMKK